MGPHFKISSKLILFSLFIALHLTTRFVVADLPNTDLMKATSCMRQFFGQTFLGETFRNSGRPLTDGEYFGILCPEVDTEEIHGWIRNNAQGDYEGTAIKKCLAKANSENLFEHYVKLGQKSEESEEHDKPAGTKDHQTPSSQYLDLRTPAEKMAEHEEPYGSEDHQTPSTQNSDLLNTPALNFKRGVCQSEIETIEFSKLTDEKEKKETVQCLAKCANNFMHRITGYLNSVVQQVMSSPLNEQIKSDPRVLDYIPNSSQQFTTSEFYSKLDKNNETPSIVPITQVGKEYLVTYSKLYIALNKYVNDRVRKSIADLANLDHHLYTMLLVYQDCAQLDCAMGSNSTPFYNLIESGAQDSYWKILQAFTNDNEDLRKWIDRQTGDWKTFCKAFIE
ncbi:uncharacterized protein LOC135833960 [Planococcus citri]|uniref:uncharacterized protein LOC135833960 n=1 Tax=Planococcus citri TaxID=170843 RepID=UPI0031F7E78C